MLTWKTYSTLTNGRMTSKRSAEEQITIQSFMTVTEIKTVTPCLFPCQFHGIMVAEVAGGQVILAVQIQLATLRVDQENDMSSRWSCEKFAEASLMRLCCSQFSLDVIIDVFSTFIVEK